MLKYDKPSQRILHHARAGMRRYRQGKRDEGPRPYKWPIKQHVLSSTLVSLLLYHIAFPSVLMRDQGEYKLIPPLISFESMNETSCLVVV